MDNVLNYKISVGTILTAGIAVGGAIYYYNANNNYYQSILLILLIKMFLE